MNISAGLPPRFLFRGRPIYVLYKYQGSLFYTPLLSSCVQLASNWVGQPLATQSRPVSRAKKATTTTTKWESYFLYSFPALASSLCSSQEANTICRQTRGNGGGTRAPLPQRIHFRRQVAPWSCKHDTLPFLMDFDFHAEKENVCDLHAGWSTDTKLLDYSEKECIVCSVEMPALAKEQRIHSWKFFPLSRWKCSALRTHKSDPV